MTSLAKQNEFLEEYYDTRCREARHMQFRHAMRDRIPQARRYRRMRRAFCKLARWSRCVFVWGRLFQCRHLVWATRTRARALRVWHQHCCGTDADQDCGARVLRQCFSGMVAKKSARAFHAWKLWSIRCHHDMMHRNQFLR